LYIHVEVPSLDGYSSLKSQYTQAIALNLIKTYIMPIVPFFSSIDCINYSWLKLKKK